MSLNDFLLVLSIPALVGVALAAGWVVFKIVDRALDDDGSPGFEDQILDELRGIRVRVDAMGEVRVDRLPHRRNARSVAEPVGAGTEGSPKVAGPSTGV